MGRIREESDEDEGGSEIEIEGQGEEEADGRRMSSLRSDRGGEVRPSYSSYPSSLSCSPPPPYRGAESDREGEGEGDEGREVDARGEEKEEVGGEGEVDSPGRRSVSELSSSMW